MRPGILPTPLSEAGVRTDLRFPWDRTATALGKARVNTMQHKRFCSIWELDPREQHQPCYADIARLFMDAYEHRFGMRAPPRRIRPYLMRYLRFGVIAPWVRSYLAGQRRSHALAELCNTPLDPTFDLRYVSRWLSRTLWRLARLHVRAGTAGYFEA